MKALAVHGLGGGFAYGVVQSGADLVAMAETSFAADVRQLNHSAPDIDVRGTPYDGPRGRPDLIFGCPACAGFSMASSSLGQWDNPEHPINDGIRDWFRWVGYVRPTVAVFESVPRTFLSEAGERLWRPLARGLKGYGFTVVTYDNQQLGVPQKRERSMLWAMQGGSPAIELDWSASRRTTQETIGHLERSADEGTYTLDAFGHTHRPLTLGSSDRIMAYMPWGTNARATVLRAEIWDVWKVMNEGRGTRPHGSYRRLHPARPSPVLLGNATTSVAHYQGLEAGAGDELRFLSAREVASLMGYPDEFKLGPGLRLTDISKALCQAVSPRVGRWAGTEAGRLLEASSPYLGGPGVDEVRYLDLTAAPEA